MFRHLNQLHTCLSVQQNDESRSEERQAVSSTAVIQSKDTHKVLTACGSYIIQQQGSSQYIMNPVLVTCHLLLSLWRKSEGSLILSINLLCSQPGAFARALLSQRHRYATQNTNILAWESVVKTQKWHLKYNYSCIRPENIQNDDNCKYLCPSHKISWRHINFYSSKLHHMYNDKIL